MTTSDTAWLLFCAYAALLCVEATFFYGQEGPLSFVRRKLDSVFRRQWIPTPATWLGRWRQRREVRRLQRLWARLPPQEQLANFIDIIDRHPEYRQAFRIALGIGNARKANEGRR